MSNAHAELEAEGFVTVRNALDDSQRARLLRLLAPHRLERAIKHRSGVVFASRHLLASTPELTHELEMAGAHAIAARFLGAAAFPVDAVYFDKQFAANWAVPAHQDRVFPTLVSDARKHRRTGGVVVAEPAARILAKLLALRIHFDPTDEHSGALCVVPGSHSSGVLATEQIRAIPLTAFQPCSADVGDVLLMRPLLLHRSSPSTRDGHRRVLHVVYAIEEPDDGLRWIRGPTPSASADGQSPAADFSVQGD